MTGILTATVVILVLGMVTTYGIIEGYLSAHISYVAGLSALSIMIIGVIYDLTRAMQAFVGTLM